MRRRLIERDWLTMAWPREYGGQDASNVKMAIFAEEMMYHEAPGKDGSGVGLLAPAVMRHGTPEQKRKYLPPIANGEVTWAQGFSEPESGSDLASLADEGRQGRWRLPDHRPEDMVQRCSSR